ncbi:MAG: CMP deaminase [Alphaproteobacteria bacterium]|jgi:dCMP deaminase|nr:CMP deaminase [Alphaproteobacteria bacterium]
MLPVDIDRLMDLAVKTANRSPNRPRKVGAVIVATDGGEIAACNDYPRGVRDLEERHEGDGRLIWQEHAERNAIFAAAREGRRLAGATIFSTYFPCADCARAIVQSGISRLYTLEPDLADPVWGRAFVASRVILEEGGVEMNFLDRDPAEMHAATMGLPRA